MLFEQHTPARAHYSLPCSVYAHSFFNRLLFSLSLPSLPLPLSLTVCLCLLQAVKFLNAYYAAGNKDIAGFSYVKSDSKSIEIFEELGCDAYFAHPTSCDPFYHHCVYSLSLSLSLSFPLPPSPSPLTAEADTTESPPQGQSNITTIVVTIVVVGVLGLFIVGGVIIAGKKRKIIR